MSTTMEQPAAKKSLGQHWLHDQASLEQIGETAQLTDRDTVLEIGPGLGTLTTLLTSKAKQVIAVELDEQLAKNLSKRVPATNLQVVQEDILTFDLTSLPPHYKVVANIPYYLTSHLLRVISETKNPPDSATLLMQKEVAERAVAKPGAMSLLSVTVQFYWDVQLGSIIPAQLFTPPPKVDSQILQLTRKRQPPLPDSDHKQFFRLVKIGFAQRRKTLQNNLSSGLQQEREPIQKLCIKAGIDPKRRAQTLRLSEWCNLYKTINA